jgi:sulfur relay protein TusB/DsrH
LLIESKGPLDGGQYAFELGDQLRALNHDVTVYLIQDGVFTARKGLTAGERLLATARQRGLNLFADEISLRQRGVVQERLAEQVKPSNMDELVDLLMERSDKAIWH